MSRHPLSKPSLPRYAGKEGLLLLLLLLSYAASALAQMGIGITPVRKELILPPGATFRYKIKTFAPKENGEDYTVKLLVEKSDWTLTPNNELIVLPANSIPYSLTRWFDLSISQLVITTKKEKGQEQNLEVIGKVPLNASGSYWGAIALTTEGPQEIHGVSARLRMLSILYITIQGTEKPAATIVNAEKTGDETATIDVRNTGNVYLRIEGTIKFLDEKANMLSEQPLETRVLLRDGLQRYVIQTPEGVRTKAAVAVVEIWAKKPVPLPERLYAEVPLR